MEPTLTLTIGDAIKKIRDHEGESPREMAERLQIDPRRLHLIELGRAPHDSTLLADVELLYGWNPQLLVAMSVLHQVQHDEAKRLIRTLTQHLQFLSLDPS